MTTLYTDIDQQPPTTASNGKRRQKTPTERALGKRQNDEDDGTMEGDTLRLDFDGIVLTGKVVKVSRRARCVNVRVTVEFAEDMQAAELVNP